MRDRSIFPGLVVGAAAALVAAMFLWIVVDVVWRGAGVLAATFFLAAPEASGRAGGIAPILVSTLAILGICLAVTAPLGLGAALPLAEAGGGAFPRAVRASLDVLAGVPSIVFGLFGNLVFCHYLGMGFSILAGGLTLACMVLPTMVRTAEQGLRAALQQHGAGAAALGMGRPASVFSVFLPVAAPALAVGTVLGAGRALAETAALLFTSGYVARMPGSPLDSGRTLSIHVYEMAMNVPGGAPRAYGTALVLLATLAVLNQAAASLAGRSARQRGVAP
jgi:phosphate transport system permease protein